MDFWTNKIKQNSSNLSTKDTSDLFQLSRSLARCRIGVSSVAFGPWIVQVCCVPWCFWIVAAFAWLGLLEMQLNNYSTRHISHRISLHIQWYDLCIWLYMVIYIYIYTYMCIHRLEYLYTVSFFLNMNFSTGIQSWLAVMELAKCSWLLNMFLFYEINILCSNYCLCICFFFYILHVECGCCSPQQSYS